MDFCKSSELNKLLSLHINDKILFSNLYYTFSLNNRVFNLYNYNIFDFRLTYIIFNKINSTYMEHDRLFNINYLSLFGDYGFVGLNVINWRYIFFRKKLLVENYNFVTPISKNYLHSLVFMNYLRPYERDEDFVSIIIKLMLNTNFDKYIILKSV